MSKNLLSVNQVLELLNICRRTLDGLVNTGQIKYIKIGKTKKFHPDDVEAFIEEGRREWRVLHGKRKKILYGEE